MHIDQYYDKSNDSFNNHYVNFIKLPYAAEISNYITSIERDIINFNKKLRSKVSSIDKYDGYLFDEDIARQTTAEILISLHTKDFLLIPSYFFELIDDGSILAQPSGELFKFERYEKDYYPLTLIEMYFLQIEQLLIHSYKNSLIGLKYDSNELYKSVLKPNDKNTVERHYKFLYEYSIKKQLEFFIWLKFNDFIELDSDDPLGMLDTADI